MKGRYLTGFISKLEKEQKTPSYLLKTCSEWKVPRYCRFPLERPSSNKLKDTRPFIWKRSPQRSGPTHAWGDTRGLFFGLAALSGRISPPPGGSSSWRTRLEYPACAFIHQFHSSEFCRGGIIRWDVVCWELSENVRVCVCAKQVERVSVCVCAWISFVPFGWKRCAVMVTQVYSMEFVEKPTERRPEMWWATLKTWPNMLAGLTSLLTRWIAFDERNDLLV